MSAQVVNWPGPATKLRRLTEPSTSTPTDLTAYREQRLASAIPTLLVELPQEACKQSITVLLIMGAVTLACHLSYVLNQVKIGEEISAAFEWQKMPFIWPWRGIA